MDLHWKSLNEKRGTVLNQQLAEKILANVMEWDTQEVKNNIRDLEHFAELKYDQYQQYQVGSRFIENLTIWLNQFKSAEERKIAFDFVKERIVFISQGELYHLINSIYPDVMKPIFREQARKLIIDNKITDEQEKKKIMYIIGRQSLIFGLSDGARLDVFRRSAPIISNEQVCINYEIKNERMKSIMEEIKKDTDTYADLYMYNGISQDKIYNIFLLDDFSGSGISYLRQEKDAADKNVWKGKITKVIKQLSEQTSDSNKIKEIDIHVILYLATEKAKLHIEEQAKKYCKEENVKIFVHVLQDIHKYKPDTDLENIMNEYFDHKIVDSHYKKGKYDNPYLGFDECSLPLVIYHNTPNNSFPIIWAGEKALFPRVTRHKDVN